MIVERIAILMRLKRRWIFMFRPWGAAVAPSTYGTLDHSYFAQQKLQAAFQGLTLASPVSPTGKEASADATKPKGKGERS
jgi:hypothetical protein